MTCIRRTAFYGNEIDFSGRTESIHQAWNLDFRYFGPKLTWTWHNGMYHVCTACQPLRQHDTSMNELDGTFLRWRWMSLSLKRHGHESGKQRLWDVRPQMFSSGCLRFPLGQWGQTSPCTGNEGIAGFCLRVWIFIQICWRTDVFLVIIDYF